MNLSIFQQFEKQAEAFAEDTFKRVANDSDPLLKHAVNESDPFLKRIYIELLKLGYMEGAYDAVRFMLANKGGNNENNKNAS